jgi:predicted acyl esterase
MRSLRLLLASLLVTPALVGLPLRAQERPDRLIQDSLAALGSLVTKETCQVRDALDGDVENGTDLPFVFCDDGVPARAGGAGAIPVPVKYAGEPGRDHLGLPKPASLEEAAAAAAADDLRPEGGNRISLDVDVTLPPTLATNRLLGTDLPTVAAPKGGYPVLVFMHGCCGGDKRAWEAASVDAAREHWHHSNAWFAARGYVVITYTARGFRNAEERGSTGTTQLDSRRYEINDYQYLVGLLVDDDRARREAGQPALFRVDPKKIAAVGGSYGGGFSWLALTDPTWTSPAHDVPIRLAAVVTKYGWTDLVESLVPSGHYRDRDPATGKSFIAPTDPANALSRDPIGVVKQSIVAGLYATGLNASGGHTTFPQQVHDGVTRLQQGEPYDGDPLLEKLVDEFLRDRSAYYQQTFWDRVEGGLRVPVYAAATWTDPLFPTMETVRFYNKLRSVAPKYPISMYVGDYQHFAQNKPKEWGDLCGDDHHICEVGDFKRADGSYNLMKTPLRVRRGINWRMNRFLDFYLRGIGRRPPHQVNATTTICPANASDVYKADEPGAEYAAPSWRALAPQSRTFAWEGGGSATTTTSTAAVDGHAQESDPVTRDRAADKCFTTDQATPGPGVVVYEDTVTSAFTMMGIPTVTLDHESTAADYWIGARLFDKAPSGTMTMVTRGLCRATAAAGPDRSCESFDLFGNGWTFEKGHRVVLEVTQADQPFLRRNNFPSTVSYSSAGIRLPVAPDRLKVDFRG